MSNDLYHRSQIMWAIAYRDHGLYSGMWFTRKDAIREHIRDKGKSWRECKRSGDRAVKVNVTIIK